MNKKFGKVAVAGVIYACFGVYLYWPYFREFSGVEYLLVLNVWVGALGCFLLSRRWVWSFWSMLFAGAVYGFGPFMLGLAKFHPVGGLMAGVVPWLFLPAAFGSAGKLRWKRVVFCCLPFLVIVLFFQAEDYFRLFAVPVQAKWGLTDGAALFAPLVMASRNMAVMGFYHVPVAPLMVGVIMLVAARRYGVMIVFCCGLALSFADAVFGVSPIMWLSIPVLCFSVVVGVGIQGLVSAGSVDSRWVLVTGIIMGVLAVVTLLLATKYFQVFAGLGAGYAKLFVQTARMYILATVAVMVVFFVARGRLRVHWLRLVVLCAAIAVDIFIGAQFIVDKIH